MSRPLIFGHRGVEQGNKVLDGVDYLELDVRKTADDILVVSHHRSLKNTVRRVLVDKNTYNQLYQKTGRKLPKLGEIVGELRGKTNFNLDIKQDKIEGDIIRFFKRYRLEAEVMVDSYDHKVLEQLAKIYPRAKFAYSFNYKDKRGLDSYKIIKGIGYFSYFLLFPLWPKILKFAANRKPFIPGASIYYRLANPGIVKFFHDRKIPVYVWPVNEERDMRRMVELGVDGIKTSKPAVLKQIIKKLKVKS